MKKVTFAKSAEVFAPPPVGNANDRSDLETADTETTTSEPPRRRQRTSLAPGRAGRREPDPAPVDPRFTLQDLSSELLHEIADYLPPDSGASRALALTSPKLKIQFREQMRSDRVQVRAQRGPGQHATIEFYTKLIVQSESLPEPQRYKALCAIARHASTYLRPGDAAPLPLLEGLMKGMREMKVPMHRYAVMHGLGAMVVDTRFKWNMKESYDPAWQGLSLGELTERRAMADFRNPFPEPFLADFFRAFNRESAAFTKDQSASIAAACECTTQVAKVVSPIPFALPLTVEIVEAHSAGMRARGAYLVLPFEARPQQWRTLHQHTETMEPGARLVMLLALSDALLDLHSPQDRIESFSTLRNSASRLESQPRAQLLNKLATILQGIDAGEQASAVRKSLLLSSADLSQPAQFECIALMVASLKTLEEDAIVPAFKHMLTAVEAGTCAAAGKLISALAGAIVQLPDEACSAMFASLLTVTGKLKAAEQATCYVSLAAGLEPFDGHPWLTESLTALHAAAAQRSLETRGQVAVALACQLQKIASTEVPDIILDEALDRIRRHPVGQRAPLLAKITGVPFRRGTREDRTAALENVLDLLDGMKQDDAVSFVSELLSELQKANCSDFEKAALSHRLHIPFVEMQPEEHIVLCKPAMSLAASLRYPLNKQCACPLLALAKTLPGAHADAAMRAVSAGLMEVVERFVNPAVPMSEERQQQRLGDLLSMAPVLPEAMQIIAVRKLDAFIDALPFFEFVKGKDKLMAYFEVCPPGLSERMYARNPASFQ